MMYDPGLNGIHNYRVKPVKEATKRKADNIGLVHILWGAIDLSLKATTLILSVKQGLSSADKGKTRKCCMVGVALSGGKIFCVEYGL